MHGVHDTAARIGPACGALGADRIGRITVEYRLVGIIVWISRQNLALAVDEKLVEMSCRREPASEKFHPCKAANRVRLLAPPLMTAVSPSSDRHTIGALFRARIFRPQNQRLL